MVLQKYYKHTLIRFITYIVTFPMFMHIMGQLLSEYDNECDYYCEFKYFIKTILINYSGLIYDPILGVFENLFWILLIAFIFSYIIYKISYSVRNKYIYIAVYILFLISLMLYCAFTAFENNRMEYPLSIGLMEVTSLLIIKVIIPFLAYLKSILRAMLKDM